jgi:hypothetical protein
MPQLSAYADTKKCDRRRSLPFVGIFWPDAGVFDEICLSFTPGLTEHVGNMRFVPHRRISYAGSVYCSGIEHGT